MATLTTGKKAPAFKGLDQNGNKISIADFKGKKIILYFYPKDDTPGCTAQACNLRDNYSALLKKGFAVVGVSTDAVKTHKKFETKYNPWKILGLEDNDYNITNIKKAYKKNALKYHPDKCGDKYQDKFQLITQSYIYLLKIADENNILDTKINKEVKNISYEDFELLNYNCYNDIMKYITENGLYIQVITLCDKNLFGFTMSGVEFYNTESNFEENNEYIHQIRSMNVKNKIIFDMNKEEIREHMVTFLVGLDIVLQSKICVTDYSSNVGKFIKLWNGDSVVHVFGQEMDLNKIECPAY